MVWVSVNSLDCTVVIIYIVQRSLKAPVSRAIEHQHHIMSIPNKAAKSATPEPALIALPFPVPVEPAVGAAPVPEAADPVMLADDPLPLSLPVLFAVAVAAASPDASVLLAVYSAGGKLVPAGPLVLATNI
jgi:hypothetical protein